MSVVANGSNISPRHIQHPYQASTLNLSRACSISNLRMSITTPPHTFTVVIYTHRNKSPCKLYQLATQRQARKSGNQNVTLISGSSLKHTNTNYNNHITPTHWRPYNSRHYHTWWVNGPSKLDLQSQLYRVSINPEYSQGVSVTIFVVTWTQHTTRKSFKRNLLTNSGISISKRRRCAYGRSSRATQAKYRPIE